MQMQRLLEQAGNLCSGLGRVLPQWKCVSSHTQSNLSKKHWKDHLSPVEKTWNVNFSVQCNRGSDKLFRLVAMGKTLISTSPVAVCRVVGQRIPSLRISQKVETQTQTWFQLSRNGTTRDWLPHGPSMGFLVCQEASSEIWSSMCQGLHQGTRNKIERDVAWVYNLMACLSVG